VAALFVIVLVVVASSRRSFGGEPSPLGLMIM